VGGRSPEQVPSKERTDPQELRLHGPQEMRRLPGYAPDGGRRERRSNRHGPLFVSTSCRQTVIRYDQLPKATQMLLRSRGVQPRRRQAPRPDPLPSLPASSVPVCSVSADQVWRRCAKQGEPCTEVMNGPETCDVCRGLMVALGTKNPASNVP